MDYNKPTPATNKITITFSGAPLTASLLARPDSHKITKPAACWPAAALLAMIPTANIQMPGYSFSLNETCIYSYRRKEYGLGEYEVYASWYAPRWEEIKVPQMPTVSHIKANLKFQGPLKWLPFQP